MAVSEQTPVELPKFTEIEDLEADQINWLSGFEHRLQSNPVRYLRTLQFMGTLATKDTIDYGAEMPAIPEDVGVTPQSDIHHYFSARYDTHHMLDGLSTKALREDEKAKMLLTVVKGMTNEVVKTGIQRSIIRANMEAPEARDELRRYNLEFYLWRILESHEAAASVDTQSKTG